MTRPSRKLLQALDARERRLRDSIAERRDELDSAVRVPDAVGDIADQAFGRVRAEVEQGLMERSLAELGEIAAVRERLANGTFGDCVDCGEPIAPARLAINLSARRCADCQARHEKLAGAR